MSRKIPKDYIATIEDFMSSIVAVDHYNTRLKHKQLEYLLFLNLNEGHNGLVFILTDACSNYWIKQYDYHEFEAIRHKLGMEGTYSGFFDILRESFNNKGLSLDIKSDDQAVLNVKYQISKGVTLNGQFELGSPTSMGRDPTLFMKVNKNFLFDLAKMVEILNKRNDDLVKEMNERLLANEAGSKSKKNESNAFGLSLSQNFPAKKEGGTKQKARTDLVNPNRKKITAKGLKFGGETVNMSAIQDATQML